MWHEDSALPDFAKLISELADLDAYVSAQGGQLAEIEIAAPIEMDERAITPLRIGPPTQTIETTFQPVWHQLRLRVESNG